MKAMNESLEERTPMLALTNVSRTYGSGESMLTVLHGVDLHIEAGEMVAIVGASGSGKSTLMNILGCLDEPSEGVYRVGGMVTHELGADALAQLRRNHFGFVFQRYQLLGDLSALGNVETPAVYAGLGRTERRARASGLLQRLGLGDRLEHRPSQLSGGQQQRVSIARSLINGGQVILADEPTGALDSRSGEELMSLFAELNAEGHTIVIVTHDMQVAQHARRIIEIRDGRIIEDRLNPSVPSRTGPISPSSLELPVAPAKRGLQSISTTRTRWFALDRLAEAFRLAMLSAWSHRLRSFLTMLGIIIGIASVVCVVALGEGSRQRILGHIRGFGTNTIDIYPGRTAGDLRAGMVHTLNLGDVEALAAQSYVDSVTPAVSLSTTLRYRDVAVNAEVNGVGADYFRVRGMSMVEGGPLNQRYTEQQAQVVVIDTTTLETLFGKRPAIGEVILIGSTPCFVVGVAKPPNQGMGAGMLNVWMPYTSVMTRMTGSLYLQSVTVRIASSVSSDAALNGVTSLLTRRHGRHDFNTFSSDALLTLVTQTSQSMTLLISAIAFISLLVGGIGVMNIMLVSVTERIHEIGVRMAVGARRSDIRNQFLIEAVLICLLGGVIGIAVALSIGWGLSASGGPFMMLFSFRSVVVAFASATLIGIVFGFMPARQAARLNPVDALARE